MSINPEYEFNPDEVKYWIDRHIPNIRWNGFRGLINSPFREDNKASFSIDAVNGRWNDFGTDESGGINKLAEKLGVESPLKKGSKLYKYPHETFNSDNQKGSTLIMDIENISVDGNHNEESKCVEQSLNHYNEPDYLASGGFAVSSTGLATNEQNCENKKGALVDSLQNIWSYALNYFEHNLTGGAVNEQLDYWHKRRINTETLQHFRVGYWKTGLIDYLKSQGFSDDALIQSGLVVRTEKGNLWERYPKRFVIPVINSGKILTMRFKLSQWADQEWNGRPAPKVVSLNIPDTEKKEKMSMGIHLYNEDILKKAEKQIFLSEGEPDTWALWQEGFPAIGIPGAKNFNPQWEEKFDHIEEICVALDGDSSGKTGAEKIEKIFTGREVLSLELPDEKDINDLLIESKNSEYFRNEINDLIRQAKKKFETPNIPPFPIKAMPLKTRNLIFEAHKSLGCPPEYIAIPMLAILGAAVGSYIELFMGIGWEEKANLYTAVVGRPGTKKTPALKIARIPITERQKRDVEEYLMKVKESKLQKKGQNSDSRDEQDTNEEEDKSSKTKIRISDRPCYYVTDATIEALIACNSKNSRGLIYIKDELTGLIDSMNQYKGGKGNDRQFWLSAWSRQAETSVRKGREVGNGMEYIDIPETFISVTGGIQPSELSKLAVIRDGKSSDGFSQRFLIGYPEAFPKFISNIPIQQKSLDEYRQLFDRIFDYGKKKRRIKLSDEAKRFFDLLHNAIVREVNEKDMSDAEQETLLKMPGQALRISLILHLCKVVIGMGKPDKINRFTMAEAWEIINYFRQSIFKIYSQQKTEKKKGMISGLLAVIKKNGGKIGIRELQQKKKFGKSSEIKFLLKQLEEGGMIKKVKEGKKVWYKLTKKFLEAG